MRDGYYDESHGSLQHTLTSAKRERRTAQQAMPMTMPLFGRAQDLVRAGRYEQALPLLRRVIDQDASHGNAWYLAGQCCRFLNDIEGAVEYLTRASELSSDEPPVFLALGIALQQRSAWSGAISAFRRAIELNPNYFLAYNSLALTQKMAGELEKALHNYDAGAKALARAVVCEMNNSPQNRIVKHRDTVGTLWMEHAAYAAMLLASQSGELQGIAWPTGAQAGDRKSKRMTSAPA